MAARHNLSTVISFEFIRTVKKKSFWIVALVVPIMIAIVGALIFFSNKAAVDQSDAQKEAEFSFAYTDESGILDTTLMQSAKAQTIASRQEGIDKVRSGKLDAYFYYNKDIAKDGVSVYGKDLGLFKNGQYSAVAAQLLTASAAAKVNDPQLISAVKNSAPTTTTTYKDGRVAAGWSGIIAPLIFLVIFYMIIAMLGNNLLNSTVEEKENRVTEMILTTLNPTSLIIGKLVATLLAGIVQGLVLLIPVAIGYFAFGTQLNIPNFDLSTLSFDPQQMIFGTLILIGGLMVFTGSLVAIGAIMPTAKEAGQWFGVCMVAVFIPFYAFSLILSDPSAIIVQFFLYFPLSAPVTALLLNAFGSLTILQGIIVSIELLILGAVIIKLAVRLFRYGAMEYSGKLNLKSAFTRKNKTA